MKFSDFLKEADEKEVIKTDNLNELEKYCQDVADLLNQIYTDLNDSFEEKDQELPNEIKSLHDQSEKIEKLIAKRKENDAYIDKLVDFFNDCLSVYGDNIDYIANFDMSFAYHEEIENLLDRVSALPAEFGIELEIEEDCECESDDCECED